MIMAFRDAISLVRPFPHRDYTPRRSPAGSPLRIRVICHPQSGWFQQAPYDKSGIPARDRLRDSRRWRTRYRFPKHVQIKEPRNDQALSHRSAKGGGLS